MYSYPPTFTQRRLTDAEPILIECLERRKHALGPQHPDSVHTLDTLANLYDVTGMCCV